MLLGAIPYCLLVFSYIIKLSGSARLPLAMPVFALVGISASMLWTGQGIYLGRAAVREATATHVQVEKVTSRLNGIVSYAYQSHVNNLNRLGCSGHQCYRYGRVLEF